MALRLEIQRGGSGWMQWAGTILILLSTVLWTAASPLSKEFLVTQWETEHGLPQSSVTAVAQTPEGYIWMGTFNGLVRFDGLRFKVFTENLPGEEERRNPKF